MATGSGCCALVAINSAIFIISALSFFHPKTKRDWRAMGVFSTFVRLPSGTPRNVLAMTTPGDASAIEPPRSAGTRHQCVPARSRTACGNRRWRGVRGPEPVDLVVGQVQDDLLVGLLERVQGVQSLEDPKQRPAGRGPPRADRLPVDQQDAAGAGELHSCRQAAEARSDDDRVPVTAHVILLPAFGSSCAAYDR